MADDIKLTVTLDASVAAALRQAAVDRGWSPEGLAADCIRQQLEVATRHRVLIERMETIDAALMGVAEAISALVEPGEGSGIDLSRVCRYRS